MKHTSKKVAALLLAAVMLIGILPGTFAADVGGFKDVKDSDWYARFVLYVSEKGLMNGVAEASFAPKATCTRAMAATVLYRIAGSPEVSEKATFSDLRADWYKASVAWAEDEGVVNGVGDGKFAPDGLVSREQLLTMIWRFAGSPKAKTEGIGKYPDAGKVSAYATDAFNWGIDSGVINGKDGKLVPAGNATRAEFAKIISVFDEMNEEEAEPVAKIAKVALLADFSSLDYESFNQVEWNAVVQWCEDNDTEYCYYKPEEDSVDARVRSIDWVVADGADVVLLNGYLYATALIEAQNKYPDVKFVGLDIGAGDMTYDYVEFYEPASNAVCITFAEEQAGYLAGYAAVRDGNTRLGFLGGMAVPTVIRYGYGFIQGADAAAEEMGVKIDINYTYAGQFYGTPELTDKMSGWYAGGTEIVFACGGGIYASVVEAAAAHGGKVIGVETDQYYIEPCIVTSAMKNIRAAIITTLDDIRDGKWNSVDSGKFRRLSLLDGEYLGLPTAEESWRFDTFTVGEYETVRIELMAGIRKVDDSTDAEKLPAVSANTKVAFVG